MIKKVHIERITCCKGIGKEEDPAWLATYRKWSKMKIHLLETSGECRGRETVKWLPCHVNKSALQAAKKNGAIADFDQSIRGIHLCFELRVSCLWSVLFLSDKQNQPLHPVHGLPLHGYAHSVEQSCREHLGNTRLQMIGSSVFKDLE